MNSFNVSREFSFTNTDWSDTYIRVFSSYSSDHAQKRGPEWLWPEDTRGSCSFGAIAAITRAIARNEHYENTPIQIY